VKLRSAAISLGQKVFRLGSAYLIALLAARALGAEEFGAYRWWLSVVNLSTVVVTFRLGPFIVREFARALAVENGAVPNLLSTSLQLFARLFVVWFIAGFFIVSFATPEDDGWLFVCSALVLLSLSATQLIQSPIEGAGRVNEAVWPTQVLAPALLIALLLALLWKQVAFGSAETLLLTAGSNALAVLALCLIYRTRLRNKPAEHNKTTPLALLRLGLPFLTVGLLTTLNSELDTLLIGWMATKTDVALFNVATRLGTLVGMPLQIMTPLLAPEVVRLTAQGHHAELENSLRRTIGAVLLSALLISLVLFAFGPFFLSLFGDQFRAAYPTLNFFLLGQIIHTAAGPVGMMAMMLGEERLVSRVLFWTCLLRAALLVLVLLHAPIAFAGLVSSIATAFWNLVLLAAVWKKMPVSPVPFIRKATEAR
jgi:O-antigen/teichoic acid export membrane protein